jgi:hypothetical protein
MKNEKTWSDWLSKIPAIGVFIEIASDFVCEGDIDYYGKIPPFRFWFKSLGWPFAFSLFLALLPFPCECIATAIRIEAKPSEVAFAIIPSLLGFGIGAYALVFGLGSDILRKIQNAYHTRTLKTGKSTASVLHVNSVFTFPLVFMAITLLFASIQKIFLQNIILSTITWFLIFFSLSLAFQLIVSLYRLGQVIILDKISQE